MTDMTVAELKANFSEVLHRVQDGEEYRILYGRTHRPVARIVPLEEKPEIREIGVLADKVQFEFADDFKFDSYEEFFGEA